MFSVSLLTKAATLTLPRFDVHRNVGMELYRADPQRHTVGDIAGSWGFFDASSFSRGFKRQFGRPPSAVLGAGSRQHLQAWPEVLSVPAGQQFGDYVRWYREATGSGYDSGEGFL